MTEKSAELDAGFFGDQAAEYMGIEFQVFARCREAYPVTPSKCFPGSALNGLPPVSIRKPHHNPATTATRVNASRQNSAKRVAGNSRMRLSAESVRYGPEDFMLVAGLELLTFTVLVVGRRNRQRPVKITLEDSDEFGPSHGNRQA